MATRGVTTIDLTTTRLRVMTWNVSCLQPSACAPSNWTSDAQSQKVVSEIMHVEPDVLSLQEVLQPLHQEELRKKYTPFGFAPSHCGHTQVLVKRNAGLELVKFFEEGPAIVAHMTKDGTEFFFVAAHLAPSKDNASMRVEQLMRISQLVPPNSPVVLAADCNMRENETGFAEAALNCKDAFALAGSPASSKFTWDSNRNKYHENGFGFTCRFDRIFVRGFDVEGIQLAANKPASEVPQHYLSDHYALYADLTLS
jgi:endonuclease/exonuclease/phosphatase family metal-dependent hydrolase